MSHSPALGALNRARELRLASETGGGDVPGVGELKTMCANARRVVALCELLGKGPIELDTPGELELLPGDDSPYFWDL